LTSTSPLDNNVQQKDGPGPGYHLLVELALWRADVQTAVYFTLAQGYRQ
jgi:hypothetical protein